MLSEALKSILTGYQNLRVSSYGAMGIWGYQDTLISGLFVYRGLFTIGDEVVFPLYRRKIHYDGLEKIPESF